MSIGDERLSAISDGKTIGLLITPEIAKELLWLRKLKEACQFVNDFADAEGRCAFCRGDLHGHETKYSCRQSCFGRGIREVLDGYEEEVGQP